ncbi:transposase [Aureibaculum sp. 2210JD6-5]|uniref:transposase n=1 Tax=Aureibaculum sp. 2210JD6-5 TaxID=3103957 RepID=UPI002AADD5D9|nr:transposase [Aureibaculum sp. 2210JD6-5]MDY7393908.1 transposase [Aureibaculum sp. 2210JD6-5]
MKYDSLTASGYYHIFNKGNNGEGIFIEEMNYFYFLNLIKKYLIPVAEIWSYCLLKNHFHLLVRIKDELEDKDISKAFSNLFNAYSKSINKKYNRNGSLFTDRFKRIKVEDEKYLIAIILYIHLNPVHHGFVSNLDKYQHSSYNAIISDKPTLIERYEVLEMLGGLDNFIHVIKNKKLQIDEQLESMIFE